MTDLKKLQVLLDDLHVPYQLLQPEEPGTTTLSVQPDNHLVLGPAGSQLVYTFQQEQLVSLEILVAAS